MDINLNIFPALNKQNPAAPDFKGNGKHEGTEFDVAIWKKTDKNGNPYYSIKLSDPYQASAQQPTPEPQTQVEEDSLPF